MITLNLWRALQHPYEDHPTFRVIRAGRYQHHYAIPPQSRLAWPTIGFEGASGKIVGIFAVMMFLCAGGWLFIVPFLFILPILLFITGTLNGASITIGISSNIARERQYGRDSVIGVTPSGLSGMTWAICSAIYHRNTVLGQFRFTISSIYQAIYIGLITLNVVLGIHWIITLRRDQQVSSTDHLITNTLLLLMGLIAFHADYIQSILMGTIIGILVPTYIQNQADARAISIGAFLALQFLLYVTIAIMVFLLLPPIFDNLSIASIILLSACRLFIFIGLREVVLTLLWRYVAYRLDLDHTDLFMPA